MKQIGQVAQEVVADLARKSNNRSSKIFSVFGQIEAVAAEVMIENGKARRIESKDIPLTALFNGKGDVARFAVIIAAEHLREFDELIKDLRS